MPSFWEQLGLTAANTAIGTGMGLLLENHEDRRQIRQQQKLTDMQVQAQKTMGIFNREQAMQMWKDTNIPAQVEMYQKAGMNPALMYGMGGGGGTTAAAQPGNVSGAHAPSGKGSAMEGMGMGLQLGMMQAQIELAKSQANKNNVEAANASGVIRENIAAQTASISQGIANETIRGRILQLEEELKKTDVNVAKGTIEERVSIIESTASKLKSEVTMAEAQNFIDQATKESKVKQIKAEAVGAILNNILTSAQTANVNQDTRNKQVQVSVDKALMSKWTNEILMSWDSLSNDNKRVTIQKMLGDFQVEVEPYLRIIEQGFDGVLKGGVPASPKAPSKVGFK